MAVLSLRTYRNIPFTRLLFALIIGILIQWYFQFSLLIVTASFIVTVALLLIYFLLPPSLKFSFRWLQGLLIIALLVHIGSIITYTKNVRHKQNWVGNNYKEGTAIVASVEEPLVNKLKSYKAVASFESTEQDDALKKVSGKLLIYFAKDSSKPTISYGSQIVFNKPLQRIKNSGNPGAFDYERYCLFNDISHQIFLKTNEYVVLQKENKNAFKAWLFNIRSAVIGVIKKYIPGQQEQGVAEALLIGYRDDLDKELVQSYSNTGVVHIIAISGLHLGLIYGLLVWFFRPFKNRRWYKPVKFVSILLVLWLFTLLAGAAASILRSAVMFSFILIGELLNRKSNIYNTLAASAFCLLVYNPFYLWDVGFQLSYAAVISIVTFMKPIYHWFAIQNKVLDKLWQLSSVTIAAQILTLPFILYHFHQFPVFFLLTNFIVVPLSALLLYALMILLLISKIPFIASVFGKISFWLLWFMDRYVQNIERFPFALMDNIQINVLQSILLMMLLISLSIWLMYKIQKAFIASLIFFALMIVLRTVDVIDKDNGKKLVVYNVPQYAAMDVMYKGRYHFIGDSDLTQNGFLQNFHLKPSRIISRVTSANTIDNVTTEQNLILSAKKKVVIVDRSFHFKESTSAVKTDVVIISKNPNLHISQLVSAFDCSEIVFDSCNPYWKIERWKKECDSLHLRFHSVTDEGAFEMQL